MGKKIDENIVDLINERNDKMENKYKLYIE